MRVGPITPIADKLLTVTEQSLFCAVEQCRAGNRLGDVSHAVQAHVEAAGLSIVRTLVESELGGQLDLGPRPGGGTRVVLDVPI